MNNHWLQNVIDSIAERGRELLGLDNKENDSKDLLALCQQLLSGLGEASGIALSQEILQRYQGMNNDDKLNFFHMLDSEFTPDFEQIQVVMERYQATRSAEDLIALNLAVEAPRQELFRRLNMAPHGTAMLVALRADLLKILRKHPALKTVDADLKHLLSSWFNRGFLQLRNIDWDSPARILEKLINYESVHEIHGWDDLRRRLMQDRRCFAFFHPAMPDEPLIFVEVALVQGLSAEVGSLLNPQTPELSPQLADTAIFYSINNTQAGLRGISFGNFLIKQVMTELAQEFPWIKISSTLSPIPSFGAAIHNWFNTQKMSPQHAEFDAILERHQELLREISTPLGIDPSQDDKLIFSSLIEHHLTTNDAELARILSELALSYLTFPNDQGKLSDPVAMFHLSNGARLQRLNPYADMSEHGISSSYGMMVNYLYDLKDVEKNHEAFVSKGQIMKSEALQKEAKKFIRPEPREHDL